MIDPMLLQSLNPFDKNNYTNANYKAEFGNQGIVGATANTLGQYTVKDGTVLDRYDFNRLHQSLILRLAELLLETLDSI